MKLSKFWLRLIIKPPPLNQVNYSTSSNRINRISTTSINDTTNINNIPTKTIIEAKLRSLKIIYFTPINPILNEFELLNKKLNSLTNSILELNLSSNSILNNDKISINLLEFELKICLKIIEEIYISLFLPLKFNRKDYEVRVSKIIGNIIKILRILNQFKLAKELDRAFFTNLNNPIVMKYGTTLTKLELWKDRRPTVKEEEEEEQQDSSSRINKFTFGKGLGLSRGKNQITWMQSLALRLEPDLYEVEGEGGEGERLTEFNNLLNEMKESNPEIIDVYMIAFLLRQSEELLSKSKGKLGLEESESIRRLLDDIRDSKKYGQEEVVIKAFGEVELIQREEEVQGSNYLESREHEDLERVVRNLVRKLDDESVILSPDTSIYNLKPTPIKVQSLFDRSQTLHLAIRFLLVHAKSCSTLEDSIQRKESVTRALTSAITLYDKLMDLTLPRVISTNPLRLARMRQRQSSALFRIIHSVTTIMDLENYSTTHHPINLIILEPILNSIQTTLKSLSLTTPPNHFPPRAKPFNLSIQLIDPRIIGIHTQFWRHLLFNLSIPAAPKSYHFHQQHQMDYPNSSIPRTPWKVMKRVLNLALACRTHDLKYSKTTSDVVVVVVNQDRLFYRTSFVIHLTRACILGGSFNSSSGPSEEEGEESIQSRLSFYLNFITDLETRGEKIRKNYVKAAVEEVIRFEFGGLVNASLRGSLEDILKGWYEGREEELEIEVEEAANLEIDDSFFIDSIPRRELPPHLMPSTSTSTSTSTPIPTSTSTISQNFSHAIIATPSPSHSLSAS